MNRFSNYLKEGVEPIVESSTSLTSAEMIKKLNEQMNMELQSAMVYLAMSSKAKMLGYLGAEKWLRTQYDEEMSHFKKLGEFLNDNNEVFIIESSQPPTKKWNSLAEMFITAMEHEKAVTKSIKEIRKAAVSLGEQAAEVFLQWYIQEQVEEEDRVQDILARLQIAGSDAAALLTIDNELGER